MRSATGSGCRDNAPASSAQTNLWGARYPKKGRGVICQLACSRMTASSGKCRLRNCANRQAKRGVVINRMWMSVFLQDGINRGINLDIGIVIFKFSCVGMVSRWVMIVIEAFEISLACRFLANGRAAKSPIVVKDHEHHNEWNKYVLKIKMRDKYLSLKLYCNAIDARIVIKDWR